MKSSKQLLANISIPNSPENWEVQRPAYEFMRDVLDYQYAHATELAGERTIESDVILEGRLARKLAEINEGLSASGIKQAIDAIKNPMATSLLEANEKIFRLLSRWVIVEETVKGEPIGRSVRYIDFDNPENNEFLVVDEFTVKGPRFPRRMDLTVFVNGIPIAVMECKRPDDTHGIEQAIKDLLAYQDKDMGVARLFNSVQLCVALMKNAARYGTILTPINRYAEWKSPFPLSLTDLQIKLGRIPTPQDVLLAGLFAKANLLDMIRTFAVFDRDGGKIVKKTTRYQQFEAVNLTMRRILDPSSKVPLRDRGGVIWHTQGSGKSLSMLWLGVKLRREKQLKNPTLLIVTDRRDLDRQIIETFMNCGFENPVQAQRVQHLRRLLNGPSGQTIMTTVQKFRDEVDPNRGSKHPVLSKNDNIFVLIDEAHRSQYKWFNAHLRRALPNACMIAFTGTPITRTTQKFGSYIHKYTMPQSVADGATVPILYESRLPQLSVWGKSRLEPIFENAFAHLTQEQRDKLKEQEITEKNIALAPDRIEMIALDIYQHYRDNFEADGFKAQVAVCCQEAAAKYYRELSKYLPDRVALLVSPPTDKDSEIWELRKPFENEEAVISQFKYEDVDRLAMMVVVDKYLTGFDAPRERVLYLDKPLKEHNLLQAIARVNRPMPEKDKDWGLIVDYWGVSGFLDKALESFNQDLTVSEVMNRRHDDQAYDDMLKCRKDVFACFPPGLSRDQVEPWVMALEKEDARARFLAAYRAFYKAVERLLPDERALNFIGDFAWLRRVRREMIVQNSMEDLELVDCSAKVRELIDKHVKGEEVRVLLEPIPILSEDFSREIQKLESDRAKASRMEHAISRTITVKMIEDPVFYESVKERLLRIIKEREQQRIDDAEEFRLLFALRDEMITGRAETAQALGLSEAVFAFYGLLQREMSTDHDNGSEHFKDLSESIYETLDTEAVIDWVHKEDVQREMRRKVKRQLRLAGCPENKLEELTIAIMDLARVRLER